jgi:hypothetical protein
METTAEHSKEPSKESSGHKKSEHMETTAEHSKEPSNESSGHQKSEETTAEHSKEPSKESSGHQKSEHMEITAEHSKEPSKDSSCHQKSIREEHVMVRKRFETVVCPQGFRCQNLHTYDNRTTKIVMMLDYIIGINMENRRRLEFLENCQNRLLIERRIKINDIKKNP